MSSMSSMSPRISRWMLLFLALMILAISLVACQMPGGAAATTRTGAALVSSPADAASATPMFPPFTIGAWMSDMMPTSASVTVYVICRTQDATMASPGAPVANLPVHVRLLDPINQSYGGTTGHDGIATVHVNVGVSRMGRPVLVDATAAWKGTTYHAQTSFMLAPRPLPTPSPTSGATVTPTPGPAGTPPGPPTPPAPPTPPEPPGPPSPVPPK